MREKFFGFGHSFHRCADTGNSFFGELLKRDFFHETIQRNATVGFCITTCGKRVVGAAGVVAGTFAAVVSQKNGAGAYHFAASQHRIFHRQNEVFGSVNITEPDARFDVFEQNGAAVFQRFFGDVFSRQVGKLNIEFLIYLFDYLFVI